MPLTNNYEVGKKYYRFNYNPCYIETCVCTEIGENEVEFFSNIDGDFVLNRNQSLYDNKEEVKELLLEKYKEWDVDNDITTPEALIKLMYKFTAAYNEDNLIAYEPFCTLLLPEKIKEYFGVDVEVNEETDEFVEWKEGNLKI